MPYNIILSKRIEYLKTGNFGKNPTNVKLFTNLNCSLFGDLHL